MPFGANEDVVFFDVIGEYPDSEVDFCLVKNGRSSQGYDAHRSALLLACRKPFIDENGEAIRRFDVGLANAKKISAEELFAPAGKNGGMNYRRAFLEPPHTNGYTNADFDRVNAVFFPKGTDELEVFEWTTDWSEYFDEGREWWGSFCLAVYEKSSTGSQLLRRRRPIDPERFHTYRAALDTRPIFWFFWFFVGFYLDILCRVLYNSRNCTLFRVFASPAQARDRYPVK